MNISSFLMLSNDEQILSSPSALGKKKVAHRAFFTPFNFKSCRALLLYFCLLSPHKVFPLHQWTWPHPVPWSWTCAANHCKCGDSSCGAPKPTLSHVAYSLSWVSLTGCCLKEDLELKRSLVLFPRSCQKTLWPSFPALNYVIPLLEWQTGIWWSCQPHISSPKHWDPVITNLPDTSGFAHTEQSSAAGAQELNFMALGLAGLSLVSSSIAPIQWFVWGRADSLYSVEETLPAGQCSVHGSKISEVFSCNSSSRHLLWS